MITLEEIMGLSYPNKNDKIESMQDIETSMFLWFEELIARQYKWNGVPKEIPFYILERTLFYYGSCVFFKVGENYFALPSAISGQLNLYGQPTRVKAIGYNGMQFGKDLRIEDEYNTKFKLIHPRDCVLIRNNEQMISTYALLKPYMTRLMFIWQSIGIHECMARVKMIVRGNKDVAKALKEQLNKMFNSKSPICIINDSKYSKEELETINFDVEYNAQPYWDDFDNTFNLMLTICGINNAQQEDKKERLLVDEVNANNEIIDTSNETRMAFRKDACSTINELFGLNVSVNKVEGIKNKSHFDDATSPKMTPPPNN